MKEGRWKGRNFLITLNQIEFFGDLKEYITHFQQFKYAIATQEEAPTTKHKHIHIYCQYEGTVTLKKDKLCGARIDKCKGSAQSNINYIRKVDEPEKRGEIIWEEGTPKLKGPVTIKEIENMTQEERKGLSIIHYKTVEKLNQKDDMHMTLADLSKQVVVRYIFGSSGYGKTYLAQQWLKELGAKTFDIVNYENGFWNGVTDTSDFALYDDFRDTDLPPVMFIKFIDYTVKNLNIKGGFVKNKYKFIFITSIQDPRSIYTGKSEEKKQWLRRMEIYEFTGFNIYNKLNNNY